MAFQIISWGRCTVKQPSSGYLIFGKFMHSPSMCLYIYICMCVCVCVCIYIYIHTHTHTHTTYIEYIAKVWVGEVSAWRELRWVEDFHAGERNQHFTLAFIWLCCYLHEVKRSQNTSSYVRLLSGFYILPSERFDHLHSHHQEELLLQTDFFITHFCAVDRRCRLLRLCSVGDEWMSAERLWSDTDGGKLKYWEKNVS